MPIHFAVLRAYAAHTFTKTYELQPNGGGVWTTAPHVSSGAWKEHGAPGKGVLLHGYKLESVTALKDIAAWLVTNTARVDLAIGMGRLREGAAVQTDGDWQDVLGRQLVNYEDHASALLVLDLDTVQGDLWDDPQEKIREAVYSVTEFDGCAFTASWSPSCGIKSGLRCRVFIELEEPRTLAQQRMAIKAINDRGGVQFDISIYSPQAFVSVSAPALYAETDQGRRQLPRPVPAPVAWFCDGDPVSLTLINAASAAALTLEQLKAIESAASSLAAGSTEDWFGAMAPGNISTLLHKALCREAFSAPEDQQAQRLGAFIARARIKLLEVSKVDGNFAKREKEHLNVQVLQKAWDDARRRKQALAPTYRAGSTHHALIAGVSVHNSQPGTVTNVTQSQVAQTPQPAAAPLPPREGMAVAIKQAAQEIYDGTPLQVLVTAPPGAGKSYAIRQVLDDGAISSRRTLVAVPTHTLAEQLTDDLKQHASKLGPFGDGNHFGVDLPGSIRHHKGRKLLCTNKKHGAMADRAERLGISAKKHACATCPDHGTCPWIKQFDDDAPGVIVKVHAALTGEEERPEDWHELAIIDESILGAIIQEPKPDVFVRDLLMVPGVRLREQREELAALLIASASNVHNAREKITMPWDSSELGLRLETEQQHRDTLAKNLVHATDKKYARDLELIERSKAVSAIYLNMRETLGSTASQGHCKAVRVYRTKRGVYVTARRRNRLPASILERGAIHLDGTAKLDGSLRVWRTVVSPTGAPYTERQIDIAPVPEHTTVTQVTDSSFAKSALVDKPDAQLEEQLDAATKTASATWLDNAMGAEGKALRAAAGTAQAVLTAKKHGRKRRADSRIFAVWLKTVELAAKYRCRQAPGNEVLLVAQKEIIGELTNMGLPDNVRTAHYGALRGLNHFKDVSAAVVVGRPAVANDELELLTEAIFVADTTINCVVHATNWGTLDGAVPMADGSIVTVRHDGHPDYLCRSVQSLISMADVVQGMARVRPYSRTPDKQCEVIYFGQLPCGLPVARICATADVRPHEAVVALACGGLTSDADFNRAWHQNLFAAANSRTALDTRQSPRWFMQRALMAWWKRRNTRLVGSVPASNRPQVEQRSTIGSDGLKSPNDMQHECAAYPYIESIQGSDCETSKVPLEKGKAAHSCCPVQPLNQLSSEPEYRFWLLTVVGNHHQQRASRRGGVHGAYARKIMVLAQGGLQPVTIAQHMGVALKDARELTDTQIETECARMLMGIIEHTVQEMPAIREFAVGVDPIEFVETWLGWGGLFAR